MGDCIGLMWKRSHGQEIQSSFILVAQQIQQEPKVLESLVKKFLVSSPCKMKGLHKMATKISSRPNSLVCYEQSYHTIPPKRLTITQSFQEINISCSLIETFKETGWCWVFRFCFLFVFSLTKADRLSRQVYYTGEKVLQKYLYFKV